MATRVAELAATVVTMARGLAAPGRGTEGAARVAGREGVYVLNQAPPALASVPLGSVIEAAVLGRTAGGLVQFAAAVGRFALPVQPAPRPGARVRFAVLRTRPAAMLRLLSVQPAATGPRPGPSAGPSAGAVSVAGEGLDAGARGRKAAFFPAIDLQTVAMRLMTDDPGAAHVVAGGPESVAMAVAIIAFFAALGSGRIEDWLGSSVLALMRGRGERAAIERLSRDLTQLAEDDSPLGGGDWRLVPLPWLALAPARRARIFLRRRGPRIAPVGAPDGGAPEGGEGEVGDEKGGEGGEGEAGREHTPEPLHFVFEVDLPELGPVQLDGLVSDSRFDLMVRTRVPIAEPARAALARVFVDTALAGGGFGTIAFQTTERFPVGDAEHHELGLTA